MRQGGIFPVVSFPCDQLPVFGRRHSFCLLKQLGKIGQIWNAAQDRNILYGVHLSIQKVNRPVDTFAVYVGSQRGSCFFFEHGGKITAVKRKNRGKML